MTPTSETGSDDTFWMVLAIEAVYWSCLGAPEMIATVLKANRFSLIINYTISILFKFYLMILYE